jgi:hypothetical protein
VTVGTPDENDAFLAAAEEAGYTASSTTGAGPK